MARNKYGAKKKVIEFQGESYSFDSKAEANQFLHLVERLKRKEIEKLKLQPEFILQDPFVIATDKTQSGKSKTSALKYTPDFEYYENGKKIIVEVKGQKTEAYVLRRSIFLTIAHDKHDVDLFMEIVQGKATRYDCSSVKIQHRG